MCTHNQFTAQSLDDKRHSFFEGNKWPDSSNFLFLGQLYGGINISTGELVSAEQLRRDAGYEATTSANTSSTLAPTASRHHHLRRRLQQQEPEKEPRRRGLAHLA